MTNTRMTVPPLRMTTDEAQRRIEQQWMLRCKAEVELSRMRRAFTVLVARHYPGQAESVVRAQLKREVI